MTLTMKQGPPTHTWRCQVLRVSFIAAKSSGIRRLDPLRNLGEWVSHPDGAGGERPPTGQETHHPSGLRAPDIAGHQAFSGNEIHAEVPGVGPPQAHEPRPSALLLGIRDSAEPLAGEGPRQVRPQVKYQSPDPGTHLLHCGPRVASVLQVTATKGIG